MRMLTVAAIVIAAVTVAAFIAAPRSEIPDDPVFAIDGPATKAAVLKLIPIGSPIELAASAMKTRGFHCSLLKNQRHAGYDPTNPRRLITHAPADFLWCDSGELWMGWRSLLTDKRWQVSFVTKDGAVASIDVSVGLTGP